MSEAEKEKIAVVVVSHNRKKLLGECLDSLLKQTYPLDAIYIIDNCSTDGTCEYLMDKDFVSLTVPAVAGPLETVKIIPLPLFSNKKVEICYIRMEENTGGAGGFHEGVKRCHQTGYDWLWLMDDDLVVCDDSLRTLVEKKNSLRLSLGRSFILNSLVLSKEKKDNNTFAFPMQELSKKGYPKMGVFYKHLSEITDKLEDGLYEWACPFNGTFIPNQVISEVGLPNSQLYIKGDEKEYFWRVLKKFRIYTVVKSRAFHPEFKDSGFDWKEYYNIRNMFVVNKYLNLSFLRNAKLVFRSIFRGLTNGKGGMVLVFHALKDGALRNLGRKEGIGKWLNM